MMRCSQVTWLRSSLLKTQTMKRGSRQERQYFAAVISSAMLFICMAPSPTSAITGRSGWAYLAASASGTAAPIEARPPESDAVIPRTHLQVAREPVGTGAGIAGDDGAVGQARGQLPGVRAAD